MAKIFIVDDDVNVAKLYKQNLQKGGHNPEIVSDRDALDKIKKGKPDLVLLDILMQVNGLDILREVKADPELSSVPILLLTNVAEEASIEKGLQYGAEGYLLKAEITPDQLLFRVNSTLEKTVPAQP